MKTHEYVNHLLAQRHLLLRINKDADLASGISFMVRRGVARDNEAVEGDELKRPWAVIESGDLKACREIIGTLLAINLTSLKLWKSSLISELKSMNASLEEINLIIKEQP